MEHFLFPVPQLELINTKLYSMDQENNNRDHYSSKKNVLNLFVEQKYSCSQKLPGSALEYAFYDPPPPQFCPKLKYRQFCITYLMVILGVLTITWLGPKDTEPCAPLVPKVKLGHSNRVHHQFLKYLGRYPPGLG